MKVEESSELAWFKSSYSTGSGGECVEVATSPTSIHVRDSKQNPTTAPTLAVPPAAWEAFLRLTHS
ncbi:DUF397 domain-containing protein [Streptomyces sp. NPDC007205]|uniref:DUF397 domain-containing protein n=1 Tax=Streptomyces sp. NPDC007205 TaxID=3154316 RepID=UPI0033CD56CE